MENFIGRDTVMGINKRNGEDEGPGKGNFGVMVMPEYRRQCRDLRHRAVKLALLLQMLPIILQGDGTIRPLAVFRHQEKDMLCHPKTFWRGIK